MVNVHRSNTTLADFKPVSPSSATSHHTEQEAELINCVKTEDLNTLMELQQQGANLLLQDAAGCTLLHHAVEAGSKDIIKYLIDN
eukprot:superscaffoldBa00014568_g26387